MLNQKGFTPILIILLVVLVFAAIGGAYYFGTQKSSPPITTYQTTATSQPVVSTPSPDTSLNPTADWKTLNGKVYLINYPTDWTAKETHIDDYFGDEVKVSNQKGSVVLRVLTGKQPYGFGPDASFQTNILDLTIEGKTFAAKEMISSRTAYVDYTYKKGGKEYQVLFGTGYPIAEDSLASLSDYTAFKVTLLKILSSLSIK